ncbi:MAG: hypothetical protein F6J97_02145 [Leptolyngbya sp. SIO4C1]|nr:hypothetical protein [Leptolyngbya sp. SIO4C1]
MRILQTTEQQTLLEVTLREGRNRQIRRVADVLGYPVVSLHRRAIGPVRLKDLPFGAYRHLTPQELASLSNFAQPVQVSQ